MNNNQTKEFYNLKELQSRSGLKYRQLINRVKEVQNKYHENDSRIFKKSNQWIIHKSLINQFSRKRKPIVKYNTMITINPSTRNIYDSESWDIFVRMLHNQFKEYDSEAITRFSIELTFNSIEHVHILTTISDRTVVRKILDNDFFVSKGNIMSKDIQPIWDQKGAIDYIEKYVKSKILRKVCKKKVVPVYDLIPKTEYKRLPLIPNFAQLGH